MFQGISIIKGDITAISADAIVNAANSTLLGGGGVDGAIHKAAGPGLLEECKSLCGCKTGEAKITKGYNLPAKWVIHTVGPVWRGGKNKEDERLSDCYKNSLLLAEKYSLKSVVFPSISTGAYGFPVERASRIALGEIKNFFERDSLVKKVTIACFDDITYEAYLSAIAEIFKEEKGDEVF